jgi:hypothetical protein
MDNSLPNDGNESDYDLISNPDNDLDFYGHEHDHSQESFSVADLSNSTSYGHIPVCPVFEPHPSQAAREIFDTVGLSKEDIQSYVAKAINPSTPGSHSSNGAGKNGIILEARTVRVYVDGLFDSWNVQ